MKIVCFFVEMAKNDPIRPSASTTSKSNTVEATRPSRPSASATYNSRTRRSKFRKRYCQAQVLDALKDINEGMSVKSASIKWMIPRTTLNDLKLGHYKPEARPGSATTLTAKEELHCWRNG